MIEGENLGKLLSTFWHHLFDYCESERDVTRKRCYQLSRFATFAQFHRPINASTVRIILSKPDQLTRMK
jgi:hypothetical protein